jgi:hypothetical protein
MLAQCVQPTPNPFPPTTNDDDEFYHDEEATEEEPLPIDPE